MAVAIGVFGPIFTRHCGGFGDGSVPGTFGPGTGRCDVCHGERFIQPPPGRGGRVEGWQGVDGSSSWGWSEDGWRCFFLLVWGVFVGFSGVII